MTFQEFLIMISKEPEYPTISYRNQQQDARTAAWEKHRTRSLRQSSKTHSYPKIHQTPQAKDFWMQPSEQVSSWLFHMPKKRKLAYDSLVEPDYFSIQHY